MSSDDPCVDVCRFDGRTGWCRGCGRTLLEIRTWRKMQPRARHALTKDLQRRLNRFRRDDKEPEDDR